MTRRSPTKQVQVFFYRAVPRGGATWASNRFDCGPALESIRDSPREFDATGPSLDKRCGVVAGDPPLLVIDNVELGGTARLYQRGQIRRWTFGADEGLTVPSFVMFFPDDVVGLVRRPGSPGPEQVAVFLELIGTDWVKLVPIVDATALGRITAGEALDRFKVRVDADTIAALDQDEGLGEAFGTILEKFDGADEITVTVSARGPRSGRLGKAVRAVLSPIADEHRASFRELKAKPHREKQLDLLEQYVTASEYVTVDTNGTVDEGIIAQAIQSAYLQARPRIPAKGG
jgi:hypothetical protein